MAIERARFQFLSGNNVPAPRINMRQIKDVLRLKLDARLSHRQIAAALDISKAAVTKYLGLAAAAGLNWGVVLMSSPRRFHILSVPRKTTTPVPDNSASGVRPTRKKLGRPICVPCSINRLRSSANRPSKPR